MFEWKKLTIGYQGAEAVTITTEIRSIFSKLKKKNTNVTVKLCKYTLGDSNCNADLTGKIDSLTINSVISQKEFVTNSTQTTDNFYGEIELTSGDGLGYKGIVAFYNATTKIIKLFANVPYPLVVGDTLNATIRCDRSSETCTNTFNNAINYGGFENIPGNDQLQKFNR